jgi:glucan phosphorylase
MLANGIPREMDLKYSNEKEAREKENFWYDEVQCNWVKTMQRFVTSCMVVHGSASNGGVSWLGGIVLDVMGWQDWRGLEENGPEHIRTWRHG